ncbi:MAG: hypothetical protein SFU99_11310 [Saprospiraceae bacterium]|nr:hypothetical protein [Saprospiraceae bacterium]
MKTTFFATLMLVFAYNLTGQIRAITEKGDTILVNKDGTWEYLDADQNVDLQEVTAVLDTNKQVFVVSPKSTKSLRSELDFFSVKYNADQWERVPEGTLNEAAEFAFKIKQSDVYGLVISEEAGFETRSLFDIAVDNMKEAVDEMEILSSEVRKVNGKDCIAATIKTKTKGVNIIFHSYYYSCDKGSIQFTAWSIENVYPKYQGVIEELLNGLLVD